MAGGPSPSNTSPSGVVTSPFISSSFASSSSSSPPNLTSFAPSSSSSSSMKGMAAEGLSVTSGASSHPFSLSSISERKPLEAAPASLLSFGSKLEPTTTQSGSADMQPLPSILIRNLPRSTNLDVLRTMLLFAKDMVDVNLIDAEFAEDNGQPAAAVARFMSLAGAYEARDRLHGKAISSDATLVVELHQNALNGRRNTVDGGLLRHGSVSTSSAGSASNGTRQSSRYNGTFQNLDKISPPSVSLGSDTFPTPESNAHIQSLFSPQSPLANSAVSSKSIINDDPSDETGQLLNDPVAFAKSGESAQQSAPRRVTNPQIPVSRFAGLSLLSTTNANPGLTSPPMSALVSPRSMAPAQSPNSAISPNGMPHLPGLGPNSGYQMNAHGYHRPNYPPVNPADQNPPCNTLYVGNLPVDTSEDELKAIFSKQRGYKRLCFRTKQNGPMCFVEFEDTSFATKALNDLYGQPLHNSVKGGIRLSFSKNPLGVRSGHSNNNAMQSSMNPHSGMSGMGGAVGVPPGFATATGPPPGLVAPPGLAPMNHSSGLGVYNSSGFGMGNNGFGGSMRQPLANGMGSTMGSNNYAGMGGDYSSYMGR